MQYFLAASTALLTLSGCIATPVDTAPSPLVDLEQSTGGRLGVAVLDHEGDVLVRFRGDDRFAMCSTFKLALAGAVLARIDAGELRGDQRLAIDPAKRVSYAPAVEGALAKGRTALTLRELMEGSVQLSDNWAANMLLEKIGGPDALTGFVRSAGDDVTRLDRMEPALNENAPGDPRDTTSPLAQAKLVRTLFLGKVLSDASRAALREIALGTTTGASRLPAGLPPGWRIAHKTGSCGTAYNDIAVIWPERGDPFIVTAYLDRPTVPGSEADKAIAEVGRIAVQASAR